MHWSQTSKLSLSKVGLQHKHGSCVHTFSAQVLPPCTASSPHLGPVCSPGAGSCLCLLLLSQALCHTDLPLALPHHAAFLCKGLSRISPSAQFRLPRIFHLLFQCFTFIPTSRSRMESSQCCIRGCLLVGIYVKVCNSAV